MNDISSATFETVAIEIAQKAGQILLTYRHKVEVLKDKGHALDFATQADIESEEYLRKEILKRFPDHGILGEEGGETNSGADYMWILDPLDGTIDFLRGLPSFSVLIALEYRHNLIAGCVYSPVSREIFSTSKGNGVRKNGKKVDVSEVSSLKESILHFRIPRCINAAEEIDRSTRILRHVAKETGLLREFWVDGVCLGNVAAGSTDGVVLTVSGPHWWDVAPGILMVQEAGGTVTDVYGKPIKDHDLSRGLVATNGKIHNQLLEIISSATKN